jgi:hypothetical protein
MDATAIAVLLIGIGIGLLGLIMVLVGWMFFRRPGVAFSPWKFAPVWRANRYLKPPGATLWIAGSVFGLVGAVLLLWVAYGRT